MFWIWHITYCRLYQFEYLIIERCFMATSDAMFHLYIYGTNGLIILFIVDWISMDKWNPSEQFRKDYINRSNLVATQDEPSCVPRWYKPNGSLQFITNPRWNNTNSAVTDLVTQETIKCFKEHSDDQIKEDVTEEDELLFPFRLFYSLFYFEIDRTSWVTS